MVGDMGDVKKVLFVCTGNTCRSPMAEGMFRKAIEKRDDYMCLGSAGVSAFGGDRISPDTAKELESRGAGLENFRSRPVTKELLDEADFVLVMTIGHLQMLLGEFPEVKEKCFLVCDFVEINGREGMDVPDPFGMGSRAYEAVGRVLDLAIPAAIAAMDES